MATIAPTTNICPMLWFTENAREAVDFYLGIFPNAKQVDTLNDPNGKLLTIDFELNGFSLVAINAPEKHPFSEAVSLMIFCDTQEEIDRYWSALTADGGKEQACGWLSDKFGFRWQVVPRDYKNWVTTPKGFEAMTKMVKLNIAELERAANS